MVLLVKNAIFTVIVPGTVAVYVPLLIARALERDPGISFVLSLPLFAGGAGVYAWCIWDFATVGRGTPIPFDPPTSLVRRGLYRYTRNPMYIAVLMVILGWTVSYSSAVMLAYAAIIFLCFHLMVVLYEEPRLRTLFGQPYLDYCAQVGRWLPKRRP